MACFKNAFGTLGENRWSKMSTSGDRQKSCHQGDELDPLCSQDAPARLIHCPISLTPVQNEDLLQPWIFPNLGLRKHRGAENPSLQNMEEWGVHLARALRSGLLILSPHEVTEPQRYNNGVETGDSRHIALNWRASARSHHLYCVLSPHFCTSYN